MLVILVGTPSSSLPAQAEESSAKKSSTKEPSAQDSSATFFEKNIRPVLAQNCFKCHGKTQAKNNLRLHSLAAMLKGGDRGPALVPGKPQDSLLISVIQHGEVLKMPPRKKLSPKEIADFIHWVKIGAPWPNSKPIQPVEEIEGQNPTWSQEQLDHWAYQALKKVSPPQPKNSKWAYNDIDRFILNRLEKNQLIPSSPIDSRGLIRRLSFNLTGLPPSPQEVEDFALNPSLEAYRALIKRYLNSEAYGEKWGRHWLDLVRYADSNGLDENLAFANAYHFRDYVIRSFNEDKPFDQFLKEQIAGDLLKTQDSKSHRDAILGTGFLSLGAKMLAEDDPVKMEMDIIDEQVDTIGKVFMGLTLGCARCHDHKFDPISTREYYSLAGILKSTRTMEHFKVVARWAEQPLASEADLKKRVKIQNEITQLQSELHSLIEISNRRVSFNNKSFIKDYLLAGSLKLLYKNVEPIGKTHKKGKAENIWLYEIEEFKRGNVGVDRTNYGAKIGTLINVGKQPNFIEHEIELPESGHYQLELRYAAEASRPTTLTINGKTLSAPVASQVTGGWYPEQQKWFIEGLFEFKKGKNLLRFEHPQFFPHIDKFLIAKEPTLTQSELYKLGESRTSKLNPSLVHRWSEYLLKSQKNPQSVFNLWHHRLSNVQTPFKSASKFHQRIHRLNQEASLQSLAQIYQQEILKALSKNQKSILLNEQERKELQENLNSLNNPLLLPDRPENYYTPAQKAKFKFLNTLLKNRKNQITQHPTVMGVTDGKIQDLKIHFRGNPLTQGKRVPRGVLTSVPSFPISSPIKQSSGRLELANWLLSPQHPLTARVIVNRIWQWNFGKGLVQSSNNFGILGTAPSHPQLLDWLALRFMKSKTEGGFGWSIKALQREILISMAYRMGNDKSKQASHLDPDNRFISHHSLRRLSAEELRDSLLYISGNLELQLGGSLLPNANYSYVTSTANVNPKIYDSKRRSIYLPVVRSALYDVFQAFDFSEPSVPSDGRQTTTSASQALFMLNSEVVAQQTRSWAEKLTKDSHLTKTERIVGIYLKSLSRLPNPKEIDQALSYLKEYSRLLVQKTKGSKKHPPEFLEARSWQSLTKVLLSSNEFIYIR